MVIENIKTNNMTLTKRFIDRYKALPEIDRRCNTDKQEWKLSKYEVIEYLILGDEEIDILWHFIVFSLFSKIIYSFSPENYKYCNDFIHWKYHEEHVLTKIYKGKLMNFIDDDCLLTDKILHEKFYNYSKDKIDDYSQFLLSIFELFNNECCNLNYNILVKVKEDDFFKEEFSDCTDKLSNIFLKSLLKQI